MIICPKCGSKDANMKLNSLQSCPDCKSEWWFNPPEDVDKMYRLGKDIVKVCGIDITNPAEEYRLRKLLEGIGERKARL